MYLYKELSFCEENKISNHSYIHIYLSSLVSTTRNPLANGSSIAKGCIEGCGVK